VIESLLLQVRFKDDDPQQIHGPFNEDGFICKKSKENRQVSKGCGMEERIKESKQDSLEKRNQFASFDRDIVDSSLFSFWNKTRDPCLGHWIIPILRVDAFTNLFHSVFR